MQSGAESGEIVLFCYSESAFCYLGRSSPQAVSNRKIQVFYDLPAMGFPIKTCIVCEEEFELRPGKPGFANRCPSCSEPEEEGPPSGSPLSSADSELNEARRRTIREMLYRSEP